MVSNERANREMIIVGACIAAVVVIVLIVGGIVTAMQRNAEEDRISDIVNDRVDNCLMWGDC